MELISYEAVAAIVIITSSEGKSGVRELDGSDSVGCQPGVSWIESVGIPRERISLVANFDTHRKGEDSYKNDELHRTKYLY